LCCEKFKGQTVKKGWKMENGGVQRLGALIKSEMRAVEKAGSSG